MGMTVTHRRRKKEDKKKEGVGWDGQEENTCQEALEEQHWFIAKYQRRNGILQKDYFPKEFIQGIS